MQAYYLNNEAQLLPETSINGNPGSAPDPRSESQYLDNGSAPAGKSDVAKADKKGGLAPYNISTSRNPSVLPSRKRKKSTQVISIEEDVHGVKAKSSKAFKKGKAGGTKALNDLANSVKPPSELVPSSGRNLNAVAEENVPCYHADEIWWHNHEDCIEAEEEADYRDSVLMALELTNDIRSQQLRAKWALQLSANKPENKMMKHLDIEEMPEYTLKAVRPPPQYRPSYPAVKWPERPCMMKLDDEEDILDLKLIESP